MNLRDYDFSVEQNIRRLANDEGFRKAAAEFVLNHRRTIKDMDALVAERHAGISQRRTVMTAIIYLTGTRFERDGDYLIPCDHMNDTYLYIQPLQAE